MILRRDKLLVSITALEFRIQKLRTAACTTLKQMRSMPSLQSIMENTALLRGSLRELKICLEVLNIHQQLQLIAPIFNIIHRISPLFQMTSTRLLWIAD